MYVLTTDLILKRAECLQLPWTPMEIKFQRTSQEMFINLYDQAYITQRILF